MTTAEATPSHTHRQILVVFSGLMAGMLLAALDQTIVSTALPTIVGELGGLDHLSWVVTVVPAHLDRQHAALREDQRHLRPQAACSRPPSSIFLVGSVLAGAVAVDAAS